MKENLELVEKLVEKTGLSYAEAKAALEKSGWDVLDALIDLESEGKLGASANYSTKSEHSAGAEQEKYDDTAEKNAKKKNRSEEYKKNTIGVFEWLRSVFDKGNTNNIEVYKDGSRILGMPVTVFVLLLLVGFWALIPLMIVGLFFGMRYRFAGPDLGKEKINDAMNKATDYADSIKQEFKNKD